MKYYLFGHELVGELISLPNAVVTVYPFAGTNHTIGTNFSVDYTQPRLHGYESNLIIWGILPLTSKSLGKSPLFIWYNRVRPMHGGNKVESPK